MQPECRITRIRSTVLFSVLVLLISGCAGTGGEHQLSARSQTHHNYGDSGTFPVPAELQDNVDFWRHVYGVWSRGEVAIHDKAHIGVIYEVVKLPAPIQNSYTQSQKSLLQSRTDHYANRMADLELRVRSNQRLSASDKDLVEKFKRAGGSAWAIQGASERVRAQRGLRERFRRGVEISGRYDKVFREIMRSHGVPEDLAYLPHVESSFQVNARSSAGAGGVWQFMPATGRQYMKVDRTIDERFDPILAANGAASYLAQAYRKLGSWPLAITSYNHGQGGMAKAKEIHGDDIGGIVKNYKGQYFGFASRNFYAEFVAAREVARNPSRYFPEGVRYEQPWLHDRLVLRSSMPSEHLARHYGTSKHSLADLNMHWRETVVNGNTDLPAGSTVWLPQGTMRRIASHPPPVPASVVVAKVLSRPASSAQPKMAITKVSKTTRPVITQSVKTRAKKTPARFHVVKPQETLYRVAVQNGITVSELRKLNRMKPNDTNIRPGQKLIVGT